MIIDYHKEVIKVLYKNEPYARINGNWHYDSGGSVLDWYIIKWENTVYLKYENNVQESIAGYIELEAAYQSLIREKKLDKILP